MGSPNPYYIRTRAHQAHPISPAHIQDSPAAPLQGANVQTYMIGILGQAAGAVSKWRALAAAIDKAYVQAYEAQAAVLQEVKEAREARRKDSEAALNFALNILTIGIGGGLATAAEKYIVTGVAERAAKSLSKEGAELVKKFADNVGDKVADKLADQAKELGEWAYKFGQPSVADAFKPPGVSPAEFGATLAESIESRAADLDGAILVLTNPLIQQSMSVESAKIWYDIIGQLPFVQEAPERIDSRHLLPNASAALWVAWAWNRDRGYWQRQSELGGFRNVGEELDFDPIRRALATCRIPAAFINKSTDGTFLDPLMMDKRSREHIDDMLETQRKDNIYDLNLIDMNKFLDWAHSPIVSEVLFYGLQRVGNVLWFKEVRKQLEKRQRFGAMAAFMPDD